MRDIVTANNAVELAISHEQSANNMSTQDPTNTAVNERRVKTAERGTRGVNLAGRPRPTILKGVLATNNAKTKSSAGANTFDSRASTGPVTQNDRNTTGAINQESGMPLSTE